MNVEDEVDDLLRELRARMPQAHGNPGETDGLAAVRARVLAGMDGAVVAVPSRRRRWAPVAVAAGVVATVVVATMVIGLPGAGPASAEAEAVLEQAARSTITVVDPPQGPDQYRYVGTHAWWLSTVVGVDPVDGSAGGPVTALVENRLDHWVPTDLAEEWLLEGGTTGRHTLLQGTEEQAAELGLTRASPAERITARCGAFHGPDANRCTGPGGWQVPTPEFLAGLPRDPDELYDRLAADAPDNSRGNAELLVYAADLLRNPLPVPADLRSALYLALARVNGLTLTPGVANLDGRTGVALGIDDPTSRVEIIVDPATGTFIGERETTRVDADGLPAGTVTSYTSVTTAVVDDLGQLPSG
jgi:hypothetical protein